jgi:hypothetical protein
VYLAKGDVKFGQVRLRDSIVLHIDFSPELVTCSRPLHR